MIAIVHDCSSTQGPAVTFQDLKHLITHVRCCGAQHTGLHFNYTGDSHSASHILILFCLINNERETLTIASLVNDRETEK